MPRLAAAVPAQVVSMAGGSDLADTGNWPTHRNMAGSGIRRFPPNWVPYREGHWAYVAPWGWTWIDNAPWGFTPFHYGRWVKSAVAGPGRRVLPSLRSGPFMRRRW